MKIPLRLAALFLATFATVSAHAELLPPAQDSSSAGGKLTVATGKATTLVISATNKAYVYFDLENVPAAVLPADVVSARLRIYFPTVTKPGAVEVHAVTPGAVLWNETTAATEPGVGMLIGTYSVGQVVGKNFAEIDVTPIVQGWLAGTPANFGFVFTASGLTKVKIGAKEGPGSGYPCALDLLLQGAAAAGTIGTAALADHAVTTLKLATGSVGSTQLTSNLTLAGTTTLGGTIELQTGVVTQAGVPLVHSTGAASFFGGLYSGNLTATGTFNAGVGYRALQLVTTGSNNTAAGTLALSNNTMGSSNTALGTNAMFANTTGSFNAAGGTGALATSMTAVKNTAFGASALAGNTSGNFNIALGYSAGQALTTGNYNIAIGHPGIAGDSGIIRIGDGVNQTDTYLTGVIHGNGSGLTNLPVPPLPVPTYAYFYLVNPPDAFATIAAGAAIPFPNDGPAGGIARSAADTFVLPAIGVYEVTWQVSVVESGQLVLFLDSGSGAVELSNTVVGRSTGTSQIMGNVLIQTTVINSALSLHAAVGNPAALTIAQYAGGTQPSTGSLVIKRIK